MPSGAADSSHDRQAEMLGKLGMAGCLLSGSEMRELGIQTQQDLCTSMAWLRQTLRERYHPSLCAALYSDEVLAQELLALQPKHGELIHRYKRACAAMRVCVLPVLACDHSGKRLQAFLGSITYQGQNLRIEAAEDTARRAFQWMAPVASNLALCQAELPAAWGDLEGDWQAGHAILQTGHTSTKPPLPELGRSSSPDPWWREHWTEQSHEDSLDNKFAKGAPDLYQHGGHIKEEVEGAEVLRSVHTRQLDKHERHWVRSRLWKGARGQDL